MAIRDRSIGVGRGPRAVTSFGRGQNHQWRTRTESHRRAVVQARTKGKVKYERLATAEGRESIKGIGEDKRLPDLGYRECQF